MYSIVPECFGRRKASLREPPQSSFQLQKCTIAESVETIVAEGMAKVSRLTAVESLDQIFSLDLAGSVAWEEFWGLLREVFKEQGGVFYLRESETLHSVVTDAFRRREAENKPACGVVELSHRIVRAFDEDLRDSSDWLQHGRAVGRAGGISADRTAGRFKPAAERQA